MIKVVLDTNVLVSALSSRSVYHWLIIALFNEEFNVYITDDILLEYHEILERKYSATTANADYLVTNDRDFNILRRINFPKISVVTIREFERILVG